MKLLHNPMGNGFRHFLDNKISLDELKSFFPDAYIENNTLVIKGVQISKREALLIEAHDLKEIGEKIKVGDAIYFSDIGNYIHILHKEC